MSGLLALIADAVLLRRAVTAQVADLSAVVAFLPLGAVTGKMAVSTARVAGLSLTTTAAESTAIGLLSAEAGLATSLAAVAGNVANLSALVALGAGSAVRGVSALGRSLVALTGEMAGLAAPVAGLLLGGRLALTAQVTVLSAVVADGVSALRALAGLVSRLATVVASTSSAAIGLLSAAESSTFHCVRECWECC